FSNTFRAKIAKCESIIQYIFSSKLLCAQALNVARGRSARYVLDGEVHTMPLNNHLAIYGDAMARVHLCPYSLTSDLARRNWHRIHNDLLSDDNFVFECLRHGLYRCIHWTDEGHQIRTKDKALATTLEAVLGAVYMDGKDEALGPLTLRMGLFDHPYLDQHRYGHGEWAYRHWLTRRAKQRQSEYERWIMERRAALAFMI
ncbi:hypothetical protein B0H19DRAFT_945249, partial [Mycena capillaripes]